MSPLQLAENHVDPDKSGAEHPGLESMRGRYEAPAARNGNVDTSETRAASDTLVSNLSENPDRGMASLDAGTGT